MLSDDYFHVDLKIKCLPVLVLQLLGTSATSGCTDVSIAFLTVILDRLGSLVVTKICIQNFFFSYNKIKNKTFKAEKHKKARSI